MTLNELLQQTKYEGFGSDETVTFVTDDSRKVCKGCLFICIQGARFDGHTLAAEMLAAGALAVVCERDLGLRQQIIVDNSRAAYSFLSAAFFGNPQNKLKVVGVTGTNGKTTTCFVLKGIFDRAGIKTGLLGTVKNMIGEKEYPAAFTTPDPYELFSLLAQMAEEKCAYCFMEVSSQALDQHRADAIHFACAVFTNLTQDHLDYHGNLENYKEAKKRLFRMADTAVVNLDDPVGSFMTEGTDCKKITYSVQSNLSSFSAKNIRLKADCVEYELVSNDAIGRIHFGVPGTFSVYNSMAAAVTALQLGLSMNEVLNGLADCKGVKGRMEVVPTGKEYTVIIDYAHTPDGLENVLSSLREVTTGRLICLFGCGGDRDKTKRPIMGSIASRLSDICVITSDNPRTEDPNGIIEDILQGVTSGRRYIEPDRKKATALALSKAKPGDVIVLAGKGHETYQILNTGKIDYDERIIIKEILEASGC